MKKQNNQKTLVIILVIIGVLLVGPRIGLFSTGENYCNTNLKNMLENKVNIDKSSYNSIINVLSNGSIALNSFDFYKANNVSCSPLVAENDVGLIYCFKGDTAHVYIGMYFFSDTSDFPELDFSSNYTYKNQIIGINEKINSAVGDFPADYYFISKNNQFLIFSIFDDSHLGTHANNPRGYPSKLIIENFIDNITCNGTGGFDWNQDLFPIGDFQVKMWMLILAGCLVILLLLLKK